MELALSLGETPKAFKFLDKSSAHETNKKMVVSNNCNINKDLGFCMALQVKGCDDEEGENSNNNKKTRYDVINERRDSSDPPVQLDLLPFSPVNISRTPSSSQHLMTFSWLTENLGMEPGLSKRQTEVNRRSIGLVEKGTGGGGGEEGSGGGTGSFLSSSPNSTTSSFQMEFSMYRSSAGGGRTSNNFKRDFEGNEIDETDRDRNGACSRASDEEENENGMARKKLRLSKEQSAFLEESFKEHNTLNPKQKQALAKQLNLRPRQVEVWFQNRRARTKLKQTEVDCEYLKKCCETLTEENRRLQKELQELRALKSSQPFYMQLPATTLTMCPSCERVATTATATATTTTTAPASNGNSTPTVAVAAAGTGTTANTTLSLAKPRAVHHHRHHHHQVTS